MLPGEYEDLYLRETSGALASRGGLEGSTPAFEDWLKQRSAATLARFVVFGPGPPPAGAGLPVQPRYA